MNDFDTIDTDLWHEIMETPGEIFDIPEMQDVMIDFQQALNSDEDFWSWIKSQCSLPANNWWKTSMLSSAVELMAIVMV